MSAQRNLFGRFVKDLSPGELTWIGVRPARKAEMLALIEVQAIQELGLQGDHRCDKTPGSGRQITLISQEYIQQIAHFAAKENIHPSVLRRNLVVKNINLSALRHQRFSIGDVIFEATALCHPCSRMERALGKGGTAAMLGHGGLCAKIIHSGRIKIGDALVPIIPDL